MTFIVLKMITLQLHKVCRVVLVAWRFREVPPLTKTPTEQKACWHLHSCYRPMERHKCTLINDFDLKLKRRRKVKKLPLYLGSWIIEEAPSLLWYTRRWAKEKTELQVGPTKMVCPLPTSNIFTPTQKWWAHLIVHVIVVRSHSPEKLSPHQSIHNLPQALPHCTFV